MNQRNLRDNHISKLNTSQQNLFEAAKLIGQMIIKSFGPFGLEKLTINNYGDFFIIRDGKTIIEKSNFEHPVGKIMLDLTETMTKNVGDGTISAILLTSFLLDNARLNIEKGIHQNIIIDGYNTALKFSLDLLDHIKLPIVTNNDWKKLIYSSLRSKFNENESSKLSQLTFDSIYSIDPTFTNSTTPDYVNIVCNGGDSLDNSKLIDGVVFDADPLSSSMTSDLKSAKIAIIHSPISISNNGIKKEINIDDPLMLPKFRDSEKELLLKNVDYLIQTGANVLFSHKTIDDLLTSRLSELGIFTVKRVPLKYIEMIEKSTGATMTNNLAELDDNNLGYCSNISTLKSMDEKNWIVLKDGVKHMSNTIFVRTQTQRHSDLLEDLLKRTLILLQQSIRYPYFVFGGGWYEFILAQKLRTYSQNIDNLQQLVLKSYSDSIELIPISLATNSGFSNIDLLVDLRKSNPSPTKYIGLDLNNRLLCNIKNKSIIEPVSVKKQLLTSATETAISILRIHDIHNITSKQETK